mgnify:CR=1 FL=1
MPASMGFRLRAACAAVTSAVLLGTAAAGADGLQDFLRSHWRLPLAPQGAPPARYSPVEASLNPEACGTCHPTQYADWRESTHAAATGPGVEGQLVEMLQRDPQSAIGCLVCHGPLAEQAPLIVRDGELRPNPDYDAALRGKGVPCAACHVRGHQRFGPPRRDGSLASAAPRETLPHNGVTRTPAFLKAEFCGSCHQFAPGGFALNGKLAREHLQRVEGEPVRPRGRAMPGLPHAGAAAPVARHSRRRHGALGAHDHRAGRRRPVPSRRRRGRHAAGDQHAHRSRLSDLRHTASRPERRAGGRGRAGDRRNPAGKDRRP